MTSLSFGERPLTSCHESASPVTTWLLLTQTTTGLLTCTFHRLFRKINIILCSIINSFLLSCLRLLGGYLKLLYPYFYGSRQMEFIWYFQGLIQSPAKPLLGFGITYLIMLSITSTSLFLPLLAITSAHATYVLGPTLIQ